MDKIECPKCHHKFELTEAISGPLVAQAQRAAQAEADARVEAARKEIEAEAQAKASLESAEMIKMATQNVAEAKRECKAAADSERAMQEKLATAQAAQAEAMRKSRELDEQRRELELTIERRTTEGLAQAQAVAERTAEERLGGKLAERDLQIESLKKASEELQRKLTQGSQQTQGEAQELALESALRARFPTDTIESVEKGVLGADCLHVVHDCGRILYESKNTKAWSAGWLTKLRDDGRAAKADILVIVSTALPKGVDAFDLYEGVWVCLPRHAVTLAVALRTVLAESSVARAAGEGVETKSGLVYQYMVGPRFKARVSAIVEAFTTMREDLDAERRAIGKQWSKREAQIDRVLLGTVGMYGDLQAIAGKSLAEIEGLSLTRLEEPK